MRQTYLDMVMKMAELGSDSLQATYRHPRQFLRGVTDFDDHGGRAAETRLGVETQIQDA